MEQAPNNDESHDRRWSGFVPPPPENDWPTWAKVRAEMNPLVCDEEVGWELEARIAQAHQQRKVDRENNNNL